MYAAENQAKTLKCPSACLSVLSVSQFARSNFISLCVHVVSSGCMLSKSRCSPDPVRVSRAFFSENPFPFFNATKVHLHKPRIFIVILSAYKKFFPEFAQKWVYRSLSHLNMKAALCEDTELKFGLWDKICQVRTTKSMHVRYIRIFCCPVFHGWYLFCLGNKDWF